jgi:catechol 2,3-dioxygenase
MEPGDSTTSLTAQPATTGWPLRRLGLKVLDLPLCRDYYRRLGLSVVNESDDGVVALGCSAKEVLRLRALRGGHLRPPHTAGLYHFALLLPDETALGSFLQHCLDQGIALDGAADHLVSQALYLRDPEGNGIEVYADRPPERWQWRNGRVSMATLPLNTPALLRQARPWDGFPPATRLGHIHLNVGDLDRSQAFYEGLGMRLMSDWGPFRFLAWDNYHHHLGINLEEGPGSRPVASDVSGLEFFEIAHLALSPGTLHDPDNITVLVATPAEESVSERHRW